MVVLVRVGASRVLSSFSRTSLAASARSVTTDAASSHADKNNVPQVKTASIFNINGLC